jgi:hypothetical protein
MGANHNVEVVQETTIPCESVALNTEVFQEAHPQVRVSCTSVGFNV